MSWLEFLNPIRDKLTWTAVVDICIVSAIIYQVLVLIRGTRVVQMVLGVGFLVVFFYLSRWLQLATVQWILTNMLPYFVFGLIVLFAAEIRRALASIGKNPLLRKFSRSFFAETYDEIVLAATTLSS
jgi:diadenylate cyclase